VHHKDWALNYLMTMNGYRLEQVGTHTHTNTHTHLEQVGVLTLLALLRTKGAQILAQLVRVLLGAGAHLCVCVLVYICI